MYSLTSSLRSAVPRTQRALFSSSALLRQGPNTQHDSFNKREKAAEDAYSRDKESEKLKALKKSIEASKKHLEQLEKDHAELEASNAKK